jgi:hypothetical protein
MRTDPLIRMVDAVIDQAGSVIDVAPRPLVRDGQ